MYASSGRIDVMNTDDESAVSVSSYCLATVVTRKAIDNLLESGTEGAYRDNHPWIVAREMFEAARAAGEAVPLLLAVDDGAGLMLSHWALILEIEAMELHRGRWDSVCRFGALREVNPIWQALDSVALKPGADQLRREAVEDLTVHRYHLDATAIRPYAICETPAFVQALYAMRATEQTGR